MPRAMCLLRLDDLGPKMCFLIWKTAQLNAGMKAIKIVVFILQLATK